MTRCEHGFITCYACKHQGLVPGCYYPGCDSERDWRDKFCPQHGGRSAARYVAMEDE